MKIFKMKFESKIYWNEWTIVFVVVDAIVVDVSVTKIAHAIV